MKKGPADTRNHVSNSYVIARACTRILSRLKRQKTGGID